MSSDQCEYKQNITHTRTYYPRVYPKQIEGKIRPSCYKDDI